MKHPLPWIILSLLLGSGLFFQLMSTKAVLKTAYVTNAKLYSEFEMSKDLDGKMKEVQFARQSIMDSLRLKLNQLDQKVAAKVATEQEKELFGRMRNEYGLKQQQFTEDNNALAQ